MSHTPGPWTAECVGCTDGENPTDVYEIVTQYTRVAEYVADRDAHLIAAAPDLLKAAQMIVGIYDSYGCGWYGQQECRDGLEIARAAIAKAEGK